MSHFTNTREKDGARHSFCVLLGEPNLLLREKIAGVLARQEHVWCVVQVNGRNEILRGAANTLPDFILAGMSVLNDRQTIDSLRKSTGQCRIIAMTDSVSEPYQQVAQRLGLDGIIEKTEVANYFSKKIQVLRKQKEMRYEK